MKRKMIHRGVSIYKRKSSPFWYVAYKDPNAPKDAKNSERYKRYSLDTVSEERALELASKLYNGAWGRKHLSEPVAWTLRELVEWTWQNFWQQKPKADKKELFFVIARFLDRFGDRLAADITTQEIRTYRADREKGGIKQSSTNRELSRIRFAYNRAVENEFLTKNPVALIKVISERRFARDRTLERPERDLILNCPDSMLIKCAKFSLATGLREGEIRAMRVKDLNLSEGTIRVESYKGGELIVRFVPIFPEAKAVLDTLDLSSEFVFTNPEGDQIPENGLIHAGWPRLLARLGIENLTFHDLRHDFATNFWKKTHDIVWLSNILGHTKIETTMRYINVKMADLARVNFLYNSRTLEKLGIEKTSETTDNQ